MSKAARNEQRKIEATFLNNVGVGILLAGGILPIFSFLATEGPPTNDRLIIGAILLIAAWFVSRMLHKGALKSAGEIED
jgi:hypothetical protein